MRAELENLLGLERKLRAEGFPFTGGVDEAGRGPLAGPVVAACVVFPVLEGVPPVYDSKQLPPKRREELAEAIKSVPGVQWALGVVDEKTIDRINILQATYLAMRQAILQIEKLDFVLVDGNPVPDLPKPSRSVVKGDSRCVSIAAASILAKVERDRIMVEYDRLYPQYGFAAHKGYGTREHLAALKKFGASPVHRLSFAPVRGVVSPPPEQLGLGL